MCRIPMRQIYPTFVDKKAPKDKGYQHKNYKHDLLIEGMILYNYQQQVNRVEKIDKA